MGYLSSFLEKKLDIILDNILIYIDLLDLRLRTLWKYFCSIPTIFHLKNIRISRFNCLWKKVQN